MSTTYNPSLSVKASTGTRIRDPRIVLAFRILWGMVAILATAFAVASIPFYVKDCGCDAQIVAGWEQLGIAPAVRITFTTWAAIDAVVMLGLSAVLIWHRADDLIALLTAVIFALLGGLQAVSPVAMEAIPLLSVPYSILGHIGFFIIPLWLHLFPSGRFVFSWIRWGFAAFLVFAIVAAFVPGVTEAYTSVAISISLIGIVLQVYRYIKISNPVERQQEKWILLALSGFVVYIFAGTLVNLLIEDMVVIAAAFAVLDNIAYAALLGLGLAVGFAVLRFGLWDVDLIINRSIVYVSLAVIVIALFAAVLVSFQVTIGQTQTLAAAAIASGAAVVAFNPVRRQVQAFVDRRIYGFRFDQNELRKAHKPITIKAPGIMTGQVIEGYELKGLLGQGGMGEVYRAVNNGQIVAIKTMLPQFVHDSNLFARFQREAVIGAEIEDKHIARVISSGRHNDTPYIIMEYLEGQPLSDAIAAGKKYHPDKMAKIMRDVCAALTTAHDRGYVHRDLKPSNIMIKPSGDAVLMDFGIVKVSDVDQKLTGSGTIGTISYMAPEQIKAARTVDARADIYALGVIAYEMLTGHLPFEGGVAHVMFAHLQQPAPDPRTLDETIPEHVAEAIMRALSKKPESRMQTANAFVQAISKEPIQS